MIVNDLREFIDFLERKKELVRIKTEVDPILEITEITDRLSKKGGACPVVRKGEGLADAGCDQSFRLVSADGVGPWS